MSTIATLVVKLLGDTADFTKNFGEAESFTKKVGSGMTKVGAGLTFGVTAPLIGLGVAAVNSASDLSETANKIDVVFGDAAGTVNAFASDADSALGQSTQAALDATATFGVFGKAAGLTGNDLAGFSTGLTGLASDLASFYNADPSDVVTALGAAMRGESEPMRQFGVLLDDATMRQTALEMGLIKTTKNALTPQQKVLAAHALIMKQTADAQGDFGRTSDGLANSQRIVTAQVQNMVASLGGFLLPVVLQVVTKVKEWLTWLNSLSPAQQEMIVKVAALAAVVGPLLIVLGTLVGAIGSIGGAIGAVVPLIGTVAGVMSGPLILAIVAVVAVVALLFRAWTTNWGGIQEKTQAAIAWIQENIQKFLAQILAWWNAHRDEIIKTVTNLWNTAQKLFNKALDYLLGLIGDVLKQIAAWWALNGDQVMATINNLWAFAQNAFKVATTMILDLINYTLGRLLLFWRNHGDEIKTIVSVLWNTLKTIFSTALAIISSVVSTVLGAIQAFWDRHGAAILGIAKAAWDSIRILISSILTIIGDIIDAFAALVTGDWKKFGDELRNIIDDAWNGILGIVTTLGGSILEFLKGLVSDILAAFNNTDWGALGTNIINGLLTGIKNGIQAVKDAAKNVAKAAYDAAMGFLKAKSPSRLFIGVGETIPQGLARGILKDAPVRAAMDNIKGIVGDAVQAINDVVAAPLYLTPPERIPVTGPARVPLVAPDRFAAVVAQTSGALTPPDRGVPGVTYQINGNFIPEPKDRITDRLRVITLLRDG